MAKLWQKKGTVLHPLVTQYIISKDLAQDRALMPFDVQASIAHAEMLAKVGLLTAKEAKTLVEALKEVLALEKKGEFVLQQENEDVHTAIENHLVQKLGDVGKKIHMGRSRNDQVLVAMRLYSKEKLLEVENATLSTAETLLAFAKKYEFIPMPGYTHTQHAMPSSVGQWAGAFVESLLDDIGILHAAQALNDQNPLGSAAGFGTGLPIDRAETTQKLGFKKLQLNALYCQNSRGKIEGFVVTALLQVMMTLGKFANDMVWFTSAEFAFFNVDKSLTTGSSIMPQKQNLDIMEVLRANVSVMMSYQSQIQTVGLNLLSGYNKDLKVTKKPLMDAFALVLSSLEIVELLMTHTTPNVKALEAALDPEIFATDEVNRLVQEGVPFREAYKKVGENLGQLKKSDPVRNIRSKKHLGATGNLNLGSYQKTIDALRKIALVG